MSPDPYSEADMWRVERPVVRQLGSSSFAVDRGVLRHAAPSDRGYLFSEVGAGVKNLALIGMADDVLDFLRDHRRRKIRNVIPSLPEIYMRITYYVPGERFTGLFPVHDAIQQLTEGIAAFAPGTTLTDVAGAAADIRGSVIPLFRGRRRKSTRHSLERTPVYIEFSYLPENGAVKIATHSITFDDLYPIVERALDVMRGPESGSADPTRI